MRQCVRLFLFHAGPALRPNIGVGFVKGSIVAETDTLCVRLAG